MHPTTLHIIALTISAAANALFYFLKGYEFSLIGFLLCVAMIAYIINEES